jgi:hypothetical protein
MRNMALYSILTIKTYFSKITVFWAMKLHRSSRWSCLLCPEEAVGSSEMLVPVYQTIPEDHNLDIHCHKNFKSLIFLQATAF